MEYTNSRQRVGRDWERPMSYSGPIMTDDNEDDDDEDNDKFTIYIIHDFLMITIQPN